MNFQHIILIIALTGGAIAIVNGLGLWGDGYIMPVEAEYELIGFEELGSGSVWDQFSIYVSSFTTAWSIVTNILYLLAFAYVLLVQFGVPELIAAFIQIGIWVVTAFWIIDFFKNR